MALPISTPARNPTLDRRADEAYQHYLTTSSAKTLARCCGLLSFFGKKDSALRRQTRFVVTCALKSKRTWRGYRSLKRYSLMTHKQRFVFVQGLAFSVDLDSKDAVVTQPPSGDTRNKVPNRRRPDDHVGESEIKSSESEELESTKFHRRFRSIKLELSQLQATVALREQELEEASAISEDFYNLLSKHDQLRADHELLIKEKEKLQFRLKKLHDKSLEQGEKNTKITHERDELISKVNGMAVTIRNLRRKPQSVSVETQTIPVPVVRPPTQALPVSNTDSINYRNLNAIVVRLVPQLTTSLLASTTYVDNLFEIGRLRIIEWKSITRHTLAMCVSLHNNIGRLKMVEILGQPMYDRLKSAVSSNSRTVGGLDELNFNPSLTASGYM